MVKLEAKDDLKAISFGILVLIGVIGGWLGLIISRIYLKRKK
jgi:uncharacterized membrane protein YsdA (DUF1294 family)